MTGGLALEASDRPDAKLSHRDRHSTGKTVAVDSSAQRGSDCGQRSTHNTSTSDIIEPEHFGLISSG